MLQSCKTSYEAVDITYDYTKDHHVKEFHFPKSNFTIAKTLDTSLKDRAIQKEMHKKLPKQLNTKKNLLTVLYNDLGSSNLISTVQLLNEKQKTKTIRKLKPYVVNDDLGLDNKTEFHYKLLIDTMEFESLELIHPHGDKYIRISSITYDGYGKKRYPYLENEIFKPLKENISLNKSNALD